MLTRAICNAFAVSLVLGLFIGLHAAQQDQTGKAPAARAESPSGAELYIKHCAVCHGNDLKGVGPAPAPYRVPPDLTKLAQRHNGKFPGAYVADVLRNGVTLPAHGPAQMPTWGMDFREMHGLDKKQVDLRIANLTNYIKSRQAK
ncbi:MAG: cytochrome c [Acidobacteriia bacterium]|nr:cytochrome c [Terriglobia bacterium]